MCIYFFLHICTFQILGGTCFGDDHQPELCLEESKPTITLDDDHIYQVSDSSPQHCSRTDSCLGRYVWYFVKCIVFFVHIFSAAAATAAATAATATTTATTTTTTTLVFV